MSLGLRGDLVEARTVAGLSSWSHSENGATTREDAQSRKKCSDLFLPPNHGGFSPRGWESEKVEDKFENKHSQKNTDPKKLHSKDENEAELKHPLPL